MDGPKMTWETFDKISAKLERAEAEIERLRGNIKEAEELLTIAMVPDGHARCEMALKALRRSIAAVHG